MSTNMQPVGAPIWFELATGDQNAARDFYSRLFGWQASEHEIGEGMTYTIFEMDGREVAACYTMMPEQAEQGMPPNWGVYFHVEDCDGSAEQARAEGGSIVVEPYEVMSHLRAAVIADPEGAAFSLQQPREHSGVGVIHELNSIGWVDLATRDIERAQRFYGALFGWQFREHASAPTPYHIFSASGVQQGGLLQMNEQWGDMPSHWSIYLRVADVDATLMRGLELGGSVCVPAFDVPNVGRIAMLTDPTGANFYVIAVNG